LTKSALRLRYALALDAESAATISILYIVKYKNRFIIKVIIMITYRVIKVITYTQADSDQKFDRVINLMGIF
tara:strand:+ start:535 stop:750 length:216 start_codon:yes stop_codon:yes gene_type:complete